MENSYSSLNVLPHMNKPVQPGNDTNTKITYMYFIQQDQPIVCYAQMNPHMKVLQRYFSGADTKPDLRLKRPGVELFISNLQEKGHGWSREMEALVTLYWLAAGLSYRVTGDNFDFPTPTVHRICHRVSRWSELIANSSGSMAGWTSGVQACIRGHRWLPDQDSPT